MEQDLDNIKIKTILSPPRTTDWMTEAGKQKLKAYGMAPPNIKQQVCTLEAFQQKEAVQCPRCNSYHTQLLNSFGATALKPSITLNVINSHCISCSFAYQIIVA
ncbi:hypothetical protein [Parafilimonas sp.]|uniref:PaaD-like zinc ribbon domain-containing protein n=1 Tax=Parafilimonas sp. TaxID=1969739 RepID=UPI0039E46DE6